MSDNSRDPKSRNNVINRIQNARFISNTKERKYMPDRNIVFLSMDNRITTKISTIHNYEAGKR